eukprot:5629480-Amphidinium_carterae.1
MGKQVGKRVVHKPRLVAGLRQAQKQLCTQVQETCKFIFRAVSSSQVHMKVTQPTSGGEEHAMSQLYNPPFSKLMVSQ